ncbi:MAG: hypothetical protein ACRDRN_15850 [Sciscionella sp.]
MRADRGGREEFVACRDRVLRGVRMRPDPLDFALRHAGDLAEEELRAVHADRRAALATRLAEWQHQRGRAEPYLREVEPMTFDHTTTRQQAEIDWHDRLLEQLPKLLAEGHPRERPETSRVGNWRSNEH